MKIIRISVVFITIVIFGGCEQPFEEDQIIKEPNWKFPYTMDIDAPFIYAALEDQGLWRKNFKIDNGIWEYIGLLDTTFSNGIDGARDVDAFENDIMVASRLERIWRSLDGGETWFKAEPGFIGKDGEDLRIFNVERSPKDKNIIYAVENDKSLFLSKDNGYTWEIVINEEFSGSSDMSNIRLNPHNPSEVWTFGSGGGPQSLSSFIGWSQFGSKVKVNVNIGNLLGNGLRDWVLDMAFDSGSGEIIYIRTTKGFYKSMDGGLSWQKTGKFIQNTSFYSLIADPRDTNSLFLAKYDSVYHSNDGLESIKFVGKFRENGDKRFGVKLKINNEFLIIGANKGIYTFPIKDIR